jgi:hypothetical protein
MEILVMISAHLFVLLFVVFVFLMLLKLVYDEMLDILLAGKQKYVWSVGRNYTMS